MQPRFRIALLLALGAVLLLAEPAMAQEGFDNGEGLLGELNDKIVTAFGLGLVVFFPAVIVIANSILHALERRKERRKAAMMRRRTGW